MGLSGPLPFPVEVPTAPQDMLVKDPNEWAQLGPLVIGDNATL